ncbi:MAG: ImmA/IrrE family metallo-endopeptidase [Thermoguttaceae bacterium]|nr:ImmA/IrrE family metallo-endopeptidase [Thermoguttaceae bacterium]
MSEIEKKELRIIADNIKRFRVYKKLSQEQLAKEAGVELSGVVALENGDEENPYGTNLLRLASFFGVTLSDISDEPRKLSSVRFRAKKSVDALKRSELVETCGRWLDNYCLVEEWLNEKTTFDAKAFGSVQNGNIPAFAANVREKLELQPNAPIQNLGDALQKSGAKYWFCNLFDSLPVFGLAISESPQATAIVINNCAQSIERRIFSTIHEFAHLLLHSESFSGDVLEEDKREEDEANLFASHFLMPNDAFLKCWDDTFGESFVDRVLFVKRYFRVSYLTVLNRFSENSSKPLRGYISGFRAAYAKKYRVALAGNLEPEPLSEFDAPPDRFRALVYKAVTLGEMSMRRGSEFLNVPYYDFYNSLPEEYFLETVKENGKAVVKA